MKSSFKTPTMVVCATGVVNVVSIVHPVILSQPSVLGLKVQILFLGCSLISQV